jgi:hypothetical protein
MLTNNGRLSISYPDVILRQETTAMPRPKRDYRVLNIRLDADTDKALQELMKLYGTRKTQSDIIRDAITEKLDRDRKKLR